jgi:hypothetical protein
MNSMNIPVLEPICLCSNRIRRFRISWHQSLTLNTKWASLIQLIYYHTFTARFNWTLMLLIYNYINLLILFYSATENSYVTLNCCKVFFFITTYATFHTTVYVSRRNTARYVPYVFAHMPRCFFAVRSRFLERIGSA